MTSDAKQEDWTGGEVLFAGGTDWAKVYVRITPLHKSDRRCIAKGRLHAIACALRRLPEEAAARSRLIKRKW